VPHRKRERQEASSDESAKHKERNEFALAVIVALFGLVGTVLGVLGYLQSRESLQIARESDSRAVRTEQLTRQLEVQQYLAEAWDLMGGEAGTTSIQRPTTDDSKLELARRLIVDKVLTLAPESSKAHRYYAVYFYARGDFRSAMNEVETALKLDPSSAEAQYDLTRLKLEVHGTPRLP